MSKIKSLFKSAKLYYFIFLVSMIVLLTHFITGVIFFPEEINLMAGTQHNFGFKLPVEATIITDDEAVINVNNEKVSNNINLSLTKPFSIMSENQCSMDMKLSVMGIPVKNVKLSVLPEIRLIPCGNTIGVRLNTDGVMILGTGDVHSNDGKVYSPCQGILKSGDLILKADGKDVNNKNELISAVESCNSDKITFAFKRNGVLQTADVELIKSEDDDKNKIGAWVRDSTQGVGTLTYYNPATKRYGALGHGITDVDTKDIMTVKNGQIMESDIVSIKKGKKGSPGELLGDIHSNVVMGDVLCNTNLGIYGNLEQSNLESIKNEAIPIALQNEIEEGPAKIYSNIDGNEVKQYDISIESVNRYSNDSTKGMVIRITDKELLNKTNGIVQGMSGSPIIQNGKLIGAVTHVFVQEPSKGYGVFIENMLKQENIL